MLIRVVPMIIMPGADAHGVFCAQNVLSPMLCEAPAAWGVGYFYFIFWCNCLQIFNPHPVQIANLPSNLAWVQLAGRSSYRKAGVYVGLEQGRAGHTQVSRSLERWQELSVGCASEGTCPRFGSPLIALPQSSAVEGLRGRIPAENGFLAKALEGLVGCCESKVALK